jgi:L-amino acid N-acyltransferase YncA
MELVTMIRRAELSDCETIAQIWNYWIETSLVTFTTELKTAPAIAELMENSPIFLCQRERELVGFATYFPFRSGPGYADAVEHSLYLRPKAAGQGDARALLDALETHAKGVGMRHLVGGISGANPAGLRFHERNGFTQVGHMPQIAQKFGQRLDLILVMKSLYP